MRPDEDGDVAAGLCPPFATVERHAVVDSTMVRARESAADEGAVLPAAVIADRQTGGRGRRGAGWWQSPGSLAVSIVLEARGPAAAPPPTWSLACGVALVETLRDLLPGIAPVVRWPNDVHGHGGREGATDAVGATGKLAGILVETTASGRAIFGIGVNTTGTAAAAPAALRRRVVTIPDLTGRPLPRLTLLAAFLPRLLGLLRSLDENPGILPTRYLPLCGLAGREVTVYVGDRVHRGICRGIAADGGLLLDTAAGPLHCLAGSLTLPGDVWPGET